MRSLFRLITDNWLYFLLLTLLAVGGAWYLMNAEKSEAILFFNQHRTPFLNYFFQVSTLLGEAYLYIILVIVYLFFRLRNSILFAATGLLVMVVSCLSKMFFAEPRPITWFRQTGMIDQLNLVEGVKLHSGATSFPSGHTMSAFALYGLIVFLLPKKWKIPGTFLLFLFSIFVALSRVYLIQHFANDVYAGAFIGVLIVIVVYYSVSMENQSG